MRTTKNILATLVAGVPLLLLYASVAGATGTPATSGFGPISVSFISASRGFVLGTSPCAHAPCTSVLTTGNGGTSWSATAAPPAPLTNPASQSASSVNEIVFANPSDGWVFDPALWATSNGGTNWHQEKLGGPVLSLVAAGGSVYAAVGSCYDTNGKCSSPTVKLERSPVQQGVWQTVPGISGRGTELLMTTQGATVWVAMWPTSAGPASIWSGRPGASWHRYPDPCYQRSQGIDLAGLASPGPNVLFELCAGNPGAGQEAKGLRLSTNGGATSHEVSNLPLGGLAYGVAAANSKNVVIDAASGASFLYHSANGGSTWEMKTLNDGGAGLFDLQFATSRLGAVVEGRPALGASTNHLLITHDGGATWSPCRL